MAGNDKELRELQGFVEALEERTRQGEQELRAQIGRMQRDLEELQERIPKRLTRMWRGLVRAIATVKRVDGCEGPRRRA